MWSDLKELYTLGEEKWKSFIKYVEAVDIHLLCFSGCLSHIRHTVDMQCKILL